MMANNLSWTNLPLTYVLWRSICSNHLFILIFFLLLRFESSWFILEIGTLSYKWFTSIFSEFVACLFILLTVSLDKKFLIFMNFNLQFFLLLIIHLILHLKYSFNPESQRFSPISSFRNFPILHARHRFVFN